MGGGVPSIKVCLKDYWLPAIFDSGSSLSFIRRDCVDRIKQLKLPYVISKTQEQCVLANSEPCVVSEVVELNIKIQGFSWKRPFQILTDCPVPCILGIDFLTAAKLNIDFFARRYSFRFCSEKEFEFESFDLAEISSLTFPVLTRQVSSPVCGSLIAISSESVELEKLMSNFPGLFSEQLGTVKGMVCQIELSDPTPVRSRPYQCSPPRLRILRELVNDLLNKGVIRKSFSQYASPAFLVPKSGGGHRMVIDYRLLNRKVVFDAFPMPSVEYAFANFSKAKVFSVIDLNSAYYQIPLSAKCRKVTAFCTPFGLFEFNKLPMGISVGCQVLSRVVDSLFGSLKHSCVYNFMDDLVIYSQSFEEHIEHLKQVFARLQKAGFTVNKDKLKLACREIPFLGHLVSAEGIRILPERVQAIQEFSVPKNLKAVRRFLGMAGFYSRFIARFSEIAEPLHALKRKNVKFVWEGPQQLAFSRLKEAMATPPVLQIPDFSREFVLVCDASDLAISAVLHQNNAEQWAPIAYSSRLLSVAERRYSIHEKECLAVVYGCEKYRSYLEHKEFSLCTDNQALAWLLHHAKELGRVGRWILRLAPYKFRVIHIRGKDNVVADCLSRQYEASAEPVTLSALILGQLPEAFHSISDHQKRDSFCRNIYDKLGQGDPSVKGFKCHNGALIYHPSRARRKRYLLPETLRLMVLEYFHSSHLSAHLGMTKTLNKIAKVFFWPGMRQDVYAFVRNCMDCQRAKPSQDSQVGLHSSNVVPCPMERVFVDFVGPIVRSRRGNIAVFVILDGFSKYVAMYPVRRISAEVVKTCLLEKYFPAFGVPQAIVSDNATVFKSRTFYNLCFSWGIRHITTSPYYPQASQVERFNRNLKVALTIYHNAQHTSWDEHLSSFTLAFNSAIHESTAATPAILFLGREMNHPLALKWKLSDLDLDREPATLKQYWEEALKNLRKAQARVAARYNDGRRQADFGVGSLVLLRLHSQSSKSQRRSAKLDCKWSLPFKIVKFITPVSVLLANPSTGVIVKRAHVSQLKRFFQAE
jgi:hypothetical protein